MFERFRNRGDAAGDEAPADGRTAVADRPAARRERDATRPGRSAVTREHMRDVRTRQREEYGGINWGSAFFGWLVAVGLGALLVGLISAAGAAVGLAEISTAEVTGNAETVGLGGGIALLVVLMIAYYAGGYVAGRMSRFDGARQGAATWLLGLLVTVVLGVVAVVLGDEYNVLQRLDLPRLPVGPETLTTGGIIATVAVILGTLLAAIVGGKVGERYHRKIDRVGVGA